jgi:hypothetical protein
MSIVREGAKDSSARESSLEESPVLKRRAADKQKLRKSLLDNYHNGLENVLLVKSGKIKPPHRVPKIP